MKILQINSSARAGNSHSSRLTAELVEGLKAKHAGSTVTLRDLGAQPVPVIDEATVQAFFTPADQRNAAQVALNAPSETAIAELKSADIVVIGAPMYNFGVSAQLKAWIDSICRAGLTFAYTDKGPTGLVTGKKVYVVLTRGGIYRNTPNDTQMPYLKSVLGFLGMTDVQFVYAEGMNMGPDAEKAGFETASAQIREALAA